MRDLFEKADEIPVTLLVGLAYITMAFLTSPTQPTSEQLYQYGWLMPTLVANGEPWRLLSCAFLHGGLIHLAFNTYALLGVGPALERSLGSLRMATVYVISALGGSLAVCMVNHPYTPVVGGSGALFGLFGAIVALQMRQSRSALGFLSYEGPRKVIGLIAVNLLLGLLIPMVSNTAHVGGLIAGFGVTFLFMTDTKATDRKQPAWKMAFIALVAGLLFHALLPATRWDWLWREAQATKSPSHRAELERSAAMSIARTTTGKGAPIQELNYVMRKLEKDRESLSGK